MNFKTMWANNEIIDTLLDKTLTVLLRLHLALKREAMKRQDTPNEAQEKVLSKNHARNILRPEKKKPA